MCSCLDSPVFAWIAVSYSSDSTLTAERILRWPVLRWIQVAYAGAQGLLSRGKQGYCGIDRGDRLLQCLRLFAVSICSPRNASPRHQRISWLAGSVKRLIHVVEARS